MKQHIYKEGSFVQFAIKYRKKYGSDHLEILQQLKDGPFDYIVDYQGGLLEVTEKEIVNIQ